MKVKNNYINHKSQKIFNNLFYYFTIRHDDSGDPVQSPWPGLTRRCDDCQGPPSQSGPCLDWSPPPL